MKRITDLSDAEILDTVSKPAMFDRLVDLECAIRGIPLLPAHPGARPKKPESSAVASFYKVGDWCFSSPTQAETVIDAILAAGPIKIKSESGMQVAFSMPTTDYYYPKVESKKAICADDYKDIKEEAESINAKIKEYDSLLNDYDEVNKQRQTVIREITERHDIALEVQYALDRINQDIARYTDLAEGNQEIAIKFLMDSRKDSSLGLDRDGTLNYVSTVNEMYPTPFKVKMLTVEDSCLEVNGGNSTKPSDSMMPE